MLEQNKILKSILSMVLATFLFTTANALFRVCDNHYPITQVLFFRHFFGLIPFLFLLRRPFQDSLRSSYLGVHLTRAVIGILSLGCLFVSIRQLPFAEATLLIFTLPFIVAILSGPFLKEPISMKGWFSILTGFVGVLFILNPAGSFIYFGAVAGLLSAFLQGIIVITNRFLNRYEKALGIVLYYHFMATVLLIPFLFFNWEWPNFKDTILLILVGVGGGLGQYFITLSSQYASASYFLPFMYTSILWGTFYGILFFKESYGWNFYAGSFLIICAGLYILIFQQKSEETEDFLALDPIKK